MEALERIKNNSKDIADNKLVLITANKRTGVAADCTFPPSSLYLALDEELSTQCMGCCWPYGGSVLLWWERKWFPCVKSDWV